jgi:hypothetical protein
MGSAAHAGGFSAQLKSIEATLPANEAEPSHGA